MRTRVKHELRCWPEFFAATRRGHKKFELRRDDRPEGFQVGDELLLKEWNPETIGKIVIPLSGVPYQEVKGYTGREVLVRVDYIMSSITVQGLMNRPGLGSFVIMSVSLVN